MIATRNKYQYLVVCFLLSNSPASGVYMPMFQNTLSVPSSFLVHSTHIYLPMKMEQTECSETSAYKLQMLGNYPKESIQRTEHGKSLKSRIPVPCCGVHPALRLCTSSLLVIFWDDHVVSCRQAITMV